MLGDISGRLIYVGTSDVREGAVEELKGAITELVEFIDANDRDRSTESPC